MSIQPQYRCEHCNEPLDDGERFCNQRCARNGIEGALAISQKNIRDWAREAGIYKSLYGACFRVLRGLASEDEYKMFVEEMDKERAKWSGSQSCDAVEVEK